MTTSTIHAVHGKTRSLFGLGLTYLLTLPACADDTQASDDLAFRAGEDETATSTAGSEDDSFPDDSTLIPGDDDDDDDFSGEDPEDVPGLGQWTFNDCSRQNQVLLDSLPNGLHAVRSPSTTCVEGADASGVKFDSADDEVTIGTSPLLTFERNLAFSVWIRPTAVNSEQIILERANTNHQTFSLRVNNKKVEFRVENRSGIVTSSAAPIKARRWTHVAGIYDGSFIFLFVDGARVGQVSAQGRLRDPNVPLRVGRGINGLPFTGKIDELWIANTPVSEFDVTRRACIAHPFELQITPSEPVSVAVDESATFQIDVTNRDFGSGCGPSFFFFGEEDFDPSLALNFTPSFIENVNPGESASVELQVTPNEEADPGLREVAFRAFQSGERTFDSQTGRVAVDVLPQTGCVVRSSRELMLTDLSIIEDPIRTSPGASDDPVAGVWHFKRLIENLAPTPEAAPALAEALFSTWLTDQHVNTFEIPARTAMQDLVLDRWPRTSDGQLDLAQAPLRLLAIVNRFDLRDLDKGQAGEGRFVFGVTIDGFPLQFTLIMEFSLPAQNEADVQRWADEWHALGSLPFPSEEYNAALQTITERFTGRNASPLRVNGSAINQLRTNEIDLAGEWELREFNLDAETGFFKPVAVKLTPDRRFNFDSMLLGDFINANESAILAERHEVPETFGGVPFLAAAIPNNIDAWFAPNVENNEARHKFSLNTCNGCHGAETNTGFLHVFPRFPGERTQLSRFLTGGTVFDPQSDEPRELNDLKRRKDDLKPIVCPTPPEARARIAAPNLRFGSGRVH
jgi:hypothetical protein